MKRNLPTPGPWAVGRDDVMVTAPGPRPGLVDIVTFAETVHRPHEEAHANACLMAAAPGMLAQMFEIRTIARERGEGALRPEDAMRLIEQLATAAIELADAED